MPTNNNAIYQELTKRAAGKDALSMEGRLKIKLDTIIHNAEGHLSRVHQFLPEFDDHSVKHSEAVLDIIAKIIGKKEVKKLSIYDLFILAASAYLHDFGMALTGYEKKVLELAEKEPLPVAVGGVAECKKNIVDNSSSIFGRQIEDALSINILPHEETKLFVFLAKLYEDYQNFRNGYTEKYKNAKDDDEKNELNENIRMEFIRKTHPKRSADYVKHWGDRIQEADTSLSEVFNDIAKVVQGHGESFEYIKGLNDKAEYEAIDDNEDSDEANLQYAAMLLRLGDIAHFTYDRAPANLRKEIKFDSDESREQWLLKIGLSNKINKTSVQTQITFKASCASPRLYCYLKKYIGYINFEIDGFNDLQSGWEIRYQIPLVRVENHVKPLNDSFETRTDLTFTLNQNRILELLMGVQLYKDPYTCLRELYQNSLDACRCAIARRKTLGEVNPTCTIEFGVEKDDKGNKWIYCLDDGKGMSRSIIENYFLKIGNSYYKSKEFFTEWAKNNGGFTPTSQFGIGIISCFMIGERLEVVTKEFEGELISFGVDGPQETFYYWNPDNISLSDKEIFEKRLSGTLIKVYLKEQYAKELDDGELDKLELLKCTDLRLDRLDSYNPSKANTESETKYVDLFKRWNRHIYKKVFDFVQIPSPEIKVQVRYANDLHDIEPRPHLAHTDSDDFKKDKKMFQEYAIGHLYDNTNMEEYYIKISHSNYIFQSIVCLPTNKEDYRFTQFFYESIYVDGISSFTQFYYEAICVDGISIKGSKFEENAHRVTLESLTHKGIFNFVGEHKPQIMVDRCSLVNPIHIDNSEQLFSDYLDEVIRITNEHFDKYKIGIGTLFYQKIWEQVIKNLPYGMEILLTNHFDKHEYPQIKSNQLSAFFGLYENIPAILSKSIITLSLKKPHQDLSRLRLGGIMDSFLLKKLFAVKSVKSTKDDTLELSFDNLSVLPYINDARILSDLLIGLPNDAGLFNSYDIVDDYLPLMSHRLAKEFSPYFTKYHGTRVVHHYYKGFISRCDDIIQEYGQFERFKYKYTVRSFEFQKKRIDFVQHRLEFDLREVFQNKYVSCYFNYDETRGEKTSEGVSIIIPNQYRYRSYRSNCFLIAKGRFTREEMDEIVRIGRKIMKSTYFQSEP